MRLPSLAIARLLGAATLVLAGAAAERFGLPIHAVGIGEGMDDLRPFEADEFGRALVGE